MSKISLTGNASGTGTFTIASPNSNSDRTVNLPDAGGDMVLTTATQTLTNKTLTTPNIDSAQFATVTGTAPLYAARAWVNFNGLTSPGTIRASGNVSSVTRNGAGDYTINFTTAMPDLNYATIGQAWYSGVTGALLGIVSPPVSTTSKQITTTNPGATGQVDVNHVSVAFFR